MEISKKPECSKLETFPFLDQQELYMTRETKVTKLSLCDNCPDLTTGPMKLLRSGLSYKSLHLMVDLLQMNNISCLATGTGKTKLTPLKIQFDILTVTLRSFPLPLLQASNYILYNYHLSLVTLLLSSRQFHMN